MSDFKLNQKEFNKLAKFIKKNKKRGRPISKESFLIAKHVLVDGFTNAKVAIMFNQKQQQVSNTVIQFIKYYRKSIPQSLQWETRTISLPSEKWPQVENIIKVEVEKALNN